MSAVVRRVEVPLLHDNHTHTSLYAALRTCPDIARLDAREAERLLRDLPSDRLSVVCGWKSNVLAPDAAALAALPPVLLINWSLHGYLISDAGLPMVSSAAPDLLAHRDDPLWRESNVPRLFEAYCRLAGLDEAKVAGFMDALVQDGVGSADDMALANPEAFRALLASPRTRTAYAGPAVWAGLAEADRAACAGIKFFLDGAIGARTAAIDTEWLGGGSPLMTWNLQALADAFAELAAKGCSVAVHAIGEGAISQALAALGRCVTAGLSFPRFRLEHAQFITEPQARKARDLGVTLSMQPNFTSDTVDYADRLPRATLARNNPFRMLIDRVGFEPGSDLIFGSDGMPHGLAYAAQWSLFPPVPAQRLSLDELIAGYGSARGIEGSFTLEIDESTKHVKVPRAGD